MLTKFLAKYLVIRMVAVSAALLAALVATAIPAGAQGGPGCHLLMNQGACVACVKKNAPQLYNPQGSPQWCARQIAERRAQGLGAAPLARGPNRISKASAAGAQTLARDACVAACMSRGADRSSATCSPWCGRGQCYRSTDGQAYCVQ